MTYTQAMFGTVQDVWQAIYEAGPDEERYPLWTMAANICMAFHLVSLKTGHVDEANMFMDLQDLAAFRARYNEGPKLIVPAIRGIIQGGKA